MRECPQKGHERATIVEQPGKPVLATLASHFGVLVLVPAARLPNQLPTNEGKAAEDGPSTRVPATHADDGVGVPFPHFLVVPDLIITVTWTGDRRDKSLSFSHSLFLFLSPSLSVTLPFK